MSVGSPTVGQPALLESQDVLDEYHIDILE